MEQAVFGTPSFIGDRTGAFAPIYVSDPRTGDTSLGDKLFDINAIRIPNPAAARSATSTRRTTCVIRRA